MLKALALHSLTLGGGADPYWLMVAMGSGNVPRLTASL